MIASTQIVALALCTCLATPAAHAGGLPAEEILGNVRRATGVMEFTGGDQVVRITGTGRILDNAAEAEGLVHPDGTFVFHQRGSLDMANSFDGHTVWRLDLGGEIYPLALGEREQTLFGGYAMAHLWFDPQFGMRFTPSPDGGNEQVVTLNFALDGQLLHGSVDIDRETWLPVRWTTTDGSQQSVWTFTGVLECGSLRLPAHVEQMSPGGGMAIYDFTAAGLTAEFNAKEFALGPQAPGDVKFDHSVSPALETRRAKSGHVLVRPLIDGEDRGWFIFDTGAGINVLDTTTAKALACREVGSVPAVGTVGSVNSPLLRAKSMTLGPVTIEDPLFIGVDFSGISAALGENIAGVIGFPVIWRAVTEIDSEQGAVSLHDPALRDQLAVEWSPLTLYNRHSCMPASFEGHDGVFVLDTGAGSSSVIFHAPATERLGLLKGRETTDSMLGGVGGFSGAKAGEVKWFELAGVRFENLPVRFATESKGAMADAYLLGNIGGALLKGRVLIVDYQAGRFALVERGALAR